MPPCASFSGILPPSRKSTRFDKIRHFFLDCRIAQLLLAVGLLAALACGTSPPQSRTATYQNRSVHYVDAGSGSQAIVLVHGWACDARVWDAQLESFASRSRVLSVDLPGHGQSEPPAGNFSMDLFARAAAAVMDDAGVEQAVLVGHSNGTPVIRQFYRLFPQRTLALIVVDGALKQVFTAEMADEMKVRLSGDDFLKIVAGFVEAMPGDELSEAARARIKEIALAQPHAAVLGGFEAAVDPEIWKPDPIDVPILLALAAQPNWNDEYLAFVKQLAPHAQIHVMDGVSHFLMIERPEEFAALVTGFLDRNELLAPN